MKAPSVSSDAGGVFDWRSRKETTAAFSRLSSERFAMPAWMEILINLAGYVGFLAIARFNRSPAKKAGQARPACCVS